MFFFMAKKYSITWIYYTTFSRFTHQLGFFPHFLSIMNNDAIKINVQSFFFLFFFCGKVLLPLYIPNGKITGHVIVLFTFLRNYQTIFHSGHIFLHHH